MSILPAYSSPRRLFVALKQMAASHSPRQYRRSAAGMAPATVCLAMAVQGLLFLMSCLSSHAVQAQVTPPPPPPRPRRVYAPVTEIARPVVATPGGSICNVLLMNNSHIFADRPVMNRTYSPPEGCSTSYKHVKLTVAGFGNGPVVSSWKLLQIPRYERTVDVFFDGLHVVRSTTSFPTNSGTRFSFDADITRYAAFLKQPRDVTVTIQGIYDQSETEHFHLTVNLTLTTGPTHMRFADAVVPISLASNGYSGFNITSAASTVSQVLSGLPRNAYRAKLEITTTATGAEDVLMLNVPQQYITANNGSSSFLPGGSFREIQAHIDGRLAGTIVPKPVFSTGVVSPVMWEPTMAIGAGITPSYFLDVTPFVGMLVDGQSHRVSLSVKGVGAGATWYTTASLHLWLDAGSAQTTGKLVSVKGGHATLMPTETVAVDAANPIHANITTTAKRTMNILGYVMTSQGRLTTRVINTRTFSNVLMIRNQSNAFHVDQTIASKSSVVMRNDAGKLLYTLSETLRYPAQLTSDFFIEGEHNHDDGDEEDHDDDYRGFITIHEGFNFDVKSTHENQVLREHQVNSRSAFVFADTSNAVAKSSGKQEFQYTSNFQGCYAHAFEKSYTSVFVDTINDKC